MNARKHIPWSRLVAASRRAPITAEENAAIDCHASAGFAMRVVAHAGLRPAAGLFGGATFERLAARALGFACAGALAMTVWAGVPSTAEARSTDSVITSTDAYLDPVGAIIEVVQS